jgi:hypothetical protein
VVWSILLCGLLCGQPQAGSQGDNSSTAAAAVPDRAELERQVQKLLKDLLSDQQAVRDEAEAKLVELGSDVLELLPETDENTPAVLRLRLDRVRDKLQRQFAEQAGKASPITLQGEMPLSKVLAALQQQSRNKIVDYREQLNQEATDPMLKVAFDNTPFWAALDDVLDQASLTLYGYPEERAIAVVARPEDESPHKDRPISYSGPFRFEVTQLESRRSYRNPQNHLLQVKIEVFWEPRLAPISLQLALDGLAATDEHGKAIAVAGEGVRGEEVTADSFSTELVLPLALPDRETRKIVSLKGKMEIIVPGRVETFRFDKLLAGRPLEQRRAGVVVGLDRVRKNNEAWEMRVIVRFDEAQGALQSHRDWVFNNELWLETPDKKRLVPDGTETVRRTESEVGVAYYFDLPKGPQGHTLVYRTAVVIMALPVEFEVKELALP